MKKTRLVTRAFTNSRPQHMTLNLECLEEPLSEAQLTARTKLQENYDQVVSMLDELVKDRGGKLVCQAGAVNGYQYTLPTAGPVQTTIVKNTAQSLLNVSQNANQPIKLNMINNVNNAQGNIQLVVDPRMGVILGSVSQPQGTTPTTATVSSATKQPQSENYKYTRSGRKLKVPQPQPTIQQPDIIEEPVPTNRYRSKTSATTHVVTPPTTTSTTQNVTNPKTKSVNKPQATVESPEKPTEETSIGGIAVGTKNIGDQVDETKKNLPDGQEITFNKMNGGRTYPSLIVVAKPNLRTKDITPQMAQTERAELDMRVKNVLMFSATKFAEWLIQQGLVRCEQYCMLHSTNYHKTKLKLGMFSDQGTFPYSGGYVWISGCCPDRYVSVFSGSIFQGAPYTPTILLKLIYHWACQTNMQNVVAWVKVSNAYVKNFYTHLRSICTAALWDKRHMMGGKNSIIQVGVISLGTTSQDGNLRQVKVEVLGVLDPSTLEIRLRACDPVQDGDRSYKRRFNNILQPLKDWVHPESKIMTDFTVDKSTLQEMGFNHISQSAFSEQNPRNYMSNYHVMEYLRKIVPRMFQNTLSLLSRQMIQQFLDELVWREMYGTTPTRAFDKIILHIAEQTRIDSTECLLDRLAKIANNPFQDWSYSNMTSTTTQSNIPSLTSINVGKSVKQSAADTINQSTKSPESVQVKPCPRKGKRKMLSASASPESEAKRTAIESKIMELGKEKNEPIQLQELYYGTMEGKKNPQKEHNDFVYFKCFLCTAVMWSNTEIMEHMISHVPPRVPGQKDAPVCRYCCAAFSSAHQMVTHIAETHSTFGNSDGDMVVCAICEQKFSNSNLLINHLSLTHYPSEMPYRCENCGYRTSSHKDVIDHYYEIHNGDDLQCPYCLKIIQLMTDGHVSVPSVCAYLLHMQRHVVRREQGRGNKCSRCCLWFNQKSALRVHQSQLHDSVPGSKVIPHTVSSNGIMITRQRPRVKQFEMDNMRTELPRDEHIKTFSSGSIRVQAPINANLPCQECEEDIDEEDHFPGEQRCQLCRYSTCCWRAFREHQQQIHNERPKTSLIVPSPLINVPLEKKMQCPCGYSTKDGNILANHLIKCNKVTAYPMEDTAPSGMLDSLGLVPKNVPEEAEKGTKQTNVINVE